MESPALPSPPPFDRLAWYGLPDPAAFAPRTEPELFSLGTLWSGRWLLFLAVLFGLGVAYLKMRHDPPVYETVAQLLVTKLTQSGVNSSDATEDVRPEIENQIVLIRSPKIIDRAVDRYKLAELLSLAQTESPSDAIRGGVKIKQQFGTRGVLELRYAGSTSADCQRVLDALITTYHESLRETRRAFNEETAQLITRAKNELLGDLNRREAEYIQFRRDAPPIWNADEKTSLHRARLAEVESRRSELLIARSQKNAELRVLEQALREKIDEETLAMLIERLANRRHDDMSRPTRSPRIDDAQDLLPLLLQERELLESFGADHPRVKDIRNRIELVRQHQREANATRAADQSQPKRGVVVIYLESLRQEIRVVEAKETELDLLFRAEQEHAKKFLEVEMRDEHYRSEIARMKDLFEAVVQRLGEMNLNKDLGGFTVDVITPPTPGVQVAPKPWLYLSVGAASGGLLGVLLACFKEVRRRSAASASATATAVPVAAG